MVLLVLLAAMAFASPAQAAITFTINTGNTTGNAQKLLIDSNNCAAAGPHASYVGVTCTRNLGPF